MLGHRAPITPAPIQPTVAIVMPAQTVRLGPPKAATVDVRGAYSRPIQPA